jgi:hypothetical protein
MRIPNQAVGVVRTGYAAGVSEARVTPALRNIGGGDGVSYNPSCSSCADGLALCLSGCSLFRWPLSGACALGCRIGNQICKANCHPGYDWGFDGPGGGVIA